MNNTPYIGFWKRAIAFIIDAFLASLPPALLCGPLLLELINNAGAEPNSESALFTMAAIMTIYVLWQILGIVSFWLYFALLESGPKQATWGKRMLGMKVVDYNGNRITFARATGRLFAKFLSYATLYIGFIMAGACSRKRALHDYIAQTYVVGKDFQPGDELPDTKFHPVWLGVIVAAILLTGVLGLLSLLARSTPAAAKTAALRLQQLARENQPLREPLTENGVTYTRSRDGYRAYFKDLEAEDYTLLLPGRNAAVCCEEFPGADCSPAGIPECN